MRWWKEALDRRRREREWDAPHPEDETIAELKSLFEAAREELLPPDVKPWKELSPQLAAHEGRARNGFSFTAALAATGPRFAAAALGVLLIVAGFFWSQRAERQARNLDRQAALALYTDRNPLNPSVLISNALEAQTGMELFQYAVHAGPERQAERLRR